jgi:hypothetical protein
MPTIAPPIPQNFILQQGNGQILLNWDLIAGVTNYVVQRSLDGITYSTIASPIVPQYLDVAVTPGTKYFYQVAAVNSSATSPFTPPQSIVPTLSASLSLGQLRLMAQQRADRVNSQFVTIPEWNTYLNQSAFELYDLLVTLYEDQYTAPPTLFQTDGLTFQYPLPDGARTYLTQAGLTFTPPPFYKLLGVDLGLDLSTNAWITLRKFDFIARNRYVFPNITSTFLGVFNLRYRLFGNTLYFIPTPSAGQFVRLWYVPRMAQLLKDTDQLDGVSGWTEYVIIDAAIKALQKEESDVSVLLAQKQMIIDRINSSAMNRDAGSPDTISNTRSWGERWGGYGSPNGDGSYGGY